MSENELLLKILDITNIYTKRLENRIKRVEEHIVTRVDIAESHQLIRAEDIWLRQLTECGTLQTSIERGNLKLLEEINSLSNQLNNLSREILSVKSLMEKDIGPRLKCIEENYTSISDKNSKCAENRLFGCEN